MSLGQKIINAIERRRDKQRRNQHGALGQFWRDGGNHLLYELPVKTGGLIIDAGGYHGEWTAGMISRYGCRSQIFEPVPAFYDYCKSYFKNNKLVLVHKKALGGKNRKAIFNLLDNGTSEYKSRSNSQQIEAVVIDVSSIFKETNKHIACFKLNIEGGEYEVLERMLETNNVERCESLLIQFHRQSNDYDTRYKNIVAELQKSHNRTWCYEMVWEKWTIKKS